MQYLNNFEKSRGVLLFAFNTDIVDYVEIAIRAATLIKHTLKLPVTLVTDIEVPSEFIDTVVLIENKLRNSRIGYASGTQWRNGGRHNAFELSPYDETLLVDSDYLMLDASLLRLMDFTQDYQIMQNNKYPATSSTNSMGPISLPYVWATVVLFKKTAKSKQLFSLVATIQDNYDYYRALYQISARNFRNDYAFTIADNVLNGYARSSQNRIPYTMLTIDKSVTQLKQHNNMLLIRESDTARVVPVQNIHVMDKQYLLTTDFKQFISSICH